MHYNGKTLGVLGGMGPLATADFLRVLANRTPAKCDQEHPHMILYSRPEIPDRTKCILEGNLAPIAYLREGLSKLKEWGADVFAVPCNTSHFFLDQIINDLKLPLVHIIDETTKQAKKVSPSGAWLMATKGTLKTNLYETHGNKLSYTFFRPDDDQQKRVDNVIDLVKSGQTDESAVEMKEVCDILWRKAKLPIIAACTELPLAFELADLPEEMMISSINALADGCINRLYY